MLALSSVPVLFFLFYFLPGAVLISISADAKEKRFESIALAVLLSLVFAPLTFALLSQAVPENDRLLLGGVSPVLGARSGWSAALSADRQRVAARLQRSPQGRQNSLAVLISPGSHCRFYANWHLSGKRLQDRR